VFTSVRRWPLVLALAGLTLAGCGSKGAPAGTPTPSGPASTPAVTTPAPTTPAATLPADDRVKALKAALLTPGDVGGGFALGQYDNTTDVGPCNKPTMQSKYPKHTQFGTDLARGTSQDDFADLEQVVTVFADASTAKSAYAVNTAELGCRKGTIDEQGTKVSFTISAPQDVTTDTGGDKATLWTLSATGTFNVDVVLVAVQFEDSVVDLSFAAGPAAKNLPDASAVAKKAIAKLAAA
jgi:hypothetical protein